MSSENYHMGQDNTFLEEAFPASNIMDWMNKSSEQVESIPTVSNSMQNEELNQCEITRMMKLKKIDNGEKGLDDIIRETTEEGGFKEMEQEFLGKSTNTRKSINRARRNNTRTNSIGGFSAKL